MSVFYFPVVGFLSFLQFFLQEYIRDLVNTFLKSLSSPMEGYTLLFQRFLAEIIFTPYELLPLPKDHCLNQLSVYDMYSETPELVACCNDTCDKLS